MEAAAEDLFNIEKVRNAWEGGVVWLVLFVGFLQMFSIFLMYTKLCTIVGAYGIFFMLLFLWLPIWEVPIVCLTYSFVVAKKPGSKKKNGEVMDEDCIWSQSPATRHSAASTKAHCKQYVWMPGVFQFTILCKAASRTYNTTSKRNIYG
ncbi:hypothetical protein FH972_005722 [Carpinus fangiana]|uniref:Uncharacterized protein n=1 Tax=Carpinus fangiana TaxID=176857 RepID=A0A5N6QQ40_9ROSI|nr:hypothetical protein FH972_005722 [Carpinus fangiana]